MMDSLHAKGAPILLLEAGNLIDSDPTRGAIVNPAVMDILLSEGPVVITPGPLELSNWNSFVPLLAGRDARLVASNLTAAGADTAGTRLARSAVVTVSGVSVGVLAVIGQAEFAQVRPASAEQWRFQSPESAIAELLPGLRKQAELIAVLACVNDTAACSLAERLSGVDVVVSGYESIPSKEPFYCGNTLFTRAGMRGQALSTVRFIVSPEAKILDWGGSNFTLDGKVPDDPEVRERVVELEKEVSRARAAATGAALPEQPQAPPAQKPAISLSPSDRYLGAASCKECHSAQYGGWLQTKHALATDVLQKDGHGSDGACLACHVTAYGERNGYSSGGEPDLRQVQCEACHGMGTFHGRGDNARPVDEQVCLRCHTSEWSPDWDYSKYLARSRH